MFAPVDFGRIETALATPPGWVELAIVAACVAVGWLVDRRVRLQSSSSDDFVKLGLGGVNRVLFPLVTLLLLVIASYAFRHWHEPFFIAIALPLTLALAAIRVLVSVVHGLFGTPAWLPLSERMITLTIWGAVLLYFIDVLPQINATLAGIEVPLGSRHVSLLDIANGTIAVVLTVALTLWLSGLIEHRLAGASHLDNNVREVLSKFIRAILLVVGVLFALQAVGIDLTLLTVFGGALGVGIGLGLQKLASNYIAGFAILLDRSIRMGDMITVDGRTGIVARVASRYVVVRSGDGTEAIVPNETLATSTVVNHTYSNKDVRVVVTVMVPHDTDVDLALRLMVEAAQAEPRVRSLPGRPEAFVVRIAESGIELELGWWINDPELGHLNLRSAINQRILASFKASNVRIAAPAREFRLVVDPATALPGTASTAGGRAAERR